MKSFIFLFFMIITANIFAADSGDTLRLSLKDAILYALSNNYGQQILEIEKKSSSENLLQSKRAILPNLSASLSQSLSNTHDTLYGTTSYPGNFNISSEAVIYNGGQIKNSILKGEALLNQADTKLIQAKNQLIIDVIRSFLSVMMNEELQKFQSEIVSISEEQTKIGESQFKAGKILKSDVMILKAQLATDIHKFNESKIERENSLLQLKNLLGATCTTSLEIVNRQTDIDINSISMPPLNEFIETTLSWLPDLEISKQKIQLSNLDIKIAKAALSPVVSLSGSLSTGYGSNNTFALNQIGNNLKEQISLTVSIPIWNRGVAKSNIAVSQYRWEQYRIESIEKELSLRMELEQEYFSVVIERSSFETNEIYQEAQKENFNTYRVQYLAGQISTTDLLQQQNNYLNSLNSYLQSKYSYLLNRKVLDVYMGLEISY